MKTNTPKAGALGFRQMIFGTVGGTSRVTSDDHALDDNSCADLIFRLHQLQPTLYRNTCNGMLTTRYGIEEWNA